MGRDTRRWKVALNKLFPEWPGWGKAFSPKEPWFLVMVVGAANFGLGLAIVIHGG